MKIKIFKTTLAVVCMIAMGTCCWKTYSAYASNQDERNLLIQENIEAMSEDEDRKFRTQKCYITENDKGSNEYICHEGSNSSTVYDCPDNTSKADVYSQSAYCIIEVSN